MAVSRFWVGGTGTWDASDTSHWAASSNGSPGQSVPGATDTATFDGSSGGGTVTVAYDMTIATINMGTYTGTLDMNGHSPIITTQFSASGSSTRGLVMGSGTWTLTGNNTAIWSVGSVGGLTLTRGSNPILCTYNLGVGTRTLNQGDVGFANQPSFSITAGTDTIAITSTRMFNLDFTGFSGTLANGARVLYGNLTLTAAMAITAGTNATTFSGTSGTQVIKSLGNTMDFPVTINSTGATVQLFDSLIVGATRTLTVTNGTFDANNKGVKTGLFASSNSNARTLLMGSGIWELTGTVTVWDTSTSTNLTVTPASSTIKVTDTSNTANTFAGGGKTFANVYWNRGASTATNTITGANTFTNFKDDGTGTHTIVFPNATTTVSSWSVSGTSGHLITLSRTGGSGTFTLTDSGGLLSSDYLSISNSTATSGTWYAGANSTDGGGNTGWIFTAAPSGSGAVVPSLASIPSIPSIG